MEALIHIANTIDNALTLIKEPKLFKGFNGYYADAEKWVREQYPYMESLNQESFKDAVYKKYRELIWSPSEDNAGRGDSQD